MARVCLTIEAGARPKPFSLIVEEKEDLGSKAESLLIDINLYWEALIPFTFTAAKVLCVRSNRRNQFISLYALYVSQGH